MQSIAAIDDETGEFIISDPKFVNRDYFSGGAGIADRILNIFDWDDYEDYKSVMPSNYTQDITEPGRITDPDPATIKD